MVDLELQVEMRMKGAWFTSLLKGVPTLSTRIYVSTLGRLESEMAWKL